MTGAAAHARQAPASPLDGSAVVPLRLGTLLRPGGRRALRALRADTVFATGFTGRGVGASRFAADVMLDLREGRPTERTRLRTVRRKPLPFPTEPLAWIGIQLTRWSLARGAVSGGRHLGLRMLDRLGSDS